jgi:galactokinase
VRRERAVAFAPGRVNLIGEHTDYNAGLALPFAIAEGVTVRAEAIGHERIHASATDLGEQDWFERGDRSPAEGWRAYVRGTIAELCEAGYPPAGARLEIAGDLPQGAGLSSSAALEVALCLALLALTGHVLGKTVDRIEIARLCARVENEWVGARTGLLDQLASLYGQQEKALCIDFRTLQIETVPLCLEGWRLVVLDSGERHANASSAYNQRRAECARACELLGVGSLREASWDAVERLDEPLRDRASHVLSENDRVRGVVAALSRGDLPAVGALLSASHASLRDCYEVSTPTVEATVDRLLQAGATGARMVGGGFGGCVLGLFASGVDPPPGAREVRPGPGAHAHVLEA